MFNESSQRKFKLKLKKKKKEIIDRKYLLFVIIHFFNI